MAKKEKVIELKPKAEKISEEHLKELQDLVNGINGAHFKIGRIEADKHSTLHDLAIMQNKVTLMQDTLNKEYGTHDINIADGTINWPKDEK
jgi:chromosome condensin MukBEF ATPase and DNA-binding subunit MukB